MVVTSFNYKGVEIVLATLEAGNGLFELMFLQISQITCLENFAVAIMYLVNSALKYVYFNSREFPKMRMETVFIHFFGSL